ncbi:methylmalonyl-CoA mutase family protein [Shinella oryzae]|uniref:Methylmalonyl-CoA mutase family protein n=1 Tax=Shinella oryzae TaxID=2871820 RepID=A0ABY9K169_9HYPH|nr:methylmalonyl-CoA mutase family protein [Shinella oryzae]WLS01533.1 methylmalonyl-CoA mutase family protein [Shinella oryzae]
MDASILRTAGFAPVDAAGWRALAEKALKGADFDATLLSQTDDGIAIQPIYPRREGALPLAHSHAATPHAGGAWTVNQRRDDADTARARAQMADDLENGATGIALVFKGSAAAHGAGMTASGETAFAKTAAARAATPFSLRLEANFQDKALSATLARALDKADARSAPVHFGLDPYSAALSGTSSEAGESAARAKDLIGFGFSGTVLNADGRLAHNAGAGEALELAIVAAALAENLRRLDAAGLAPETTFAATALCLAADQDQFLTTAKFRAARLLHARMQAACGISEPKPAHIHAETSWRMLTRLDPETNILRNTIAVFSAGTGGADEITVLPHTLALGVPDPFARRIARNMQVVLITESHLANVADPAAGAGGIEALTDALAEKAWELFADIEKAGGLSAAIASGDIARRVETARQARRVRPIVGTTLFALKAERPVTVLGPLSDVATPGLRPVLLADCVEAA